MTLEVREPAAKYLVRVGRAEAKAPAFLKEWRVLPLAELAEFVTSGSRGWARHYAENGATFIRSQNLAEGKLDFSDHQHVNPPDGAEGSRTRVSLGDLLVTITGNSVGNVAFVDRPIGEAYISQHVGLVRLIDPAMAAFVCRFLAPGAPGNAQILSSQSGQSKPGLNLQNLREFFIALPSSVEQEAIINALSDVDTLLAGLDRLIAKKRDLKQAAMQQLLTGQTRLPGFQGEWEVKRLGHIADVIDPHPSHRAPDEVGSGIPFLGIGDLDESGNIVGGKLRLVSPTVLAEHAIRYSLDDELIGLGRVASIGKVVTLRKQAQDYTISPTLG